MSKIIEKLIEPTGKQKRENEVRNTFDAVGKIGFDSGHREGARRGFGLADSVGFAEWCGTYGWHFVFEIGTFFDGFLEYKSGQQLYEQFLTEKYGK